MDQKVGLVKRFQYEFDKMFSRGPWAMLAGLTVLSLSVVAVFTLILVVFQLTPGEDPPMDMLEAFWFSLIGTMGEGSIAGRESIWSFRLLTFSIALSSIFVISNLIGLIANAIQTKLSDLRKGKTEVIENGHTVILGWTDQVFTILRELIAANEDQPKATIVILGQEDKSVMEDQIRQKIGQSGKTEILCRTGSPMEIADLKLAGLETAKSILILSPNSPIQDAEVIKTVLAITRNPNRRFDPYHIVAGIRYPKNRDVTRVIGMGEVEWIHMSDVISRIIAQTCRQAGLSIIYTELLDFGRNEIYFTDAKSLAGYTFQESLHAFENCGVIGLVIHGKGPKLNPPMETVIGKGDKLIVISGDDRRMTCDPDPKTLVDPRAISPNGFSTQVKENILILGWNWNAPNIIRQIDHYVVPGSKVNVLSNDESAAEVVNRLGTEMKNLRLKYVKGEINDRETLESRKLSRMDHIILLSYSDTLSIQEADAVTLMTLLHLRDIAEKNGYGYSIVTEILDVRNSRLAETSKADDFIVSERLISLMMTQVEENKFLNEVFEDLFSPEGSEIYLKPAGSYVQPGIPVNFYTVIESAARQKEVALGYRLASHAADAEKLFGVVINPNKMERVAFSENDRIIVLAES